MKSQNFDCFILIFFYKSFSSVLLFLPRAVDNLMKDEKRDEDVDIKKQYYISSHMTQ